MVGYTGVSKEVDKERRGTGWGRKWEKKTKKWKRKS